MNRNDTATITVSVNDASSDNTFGSLEYQKVVVALTDDDTAGFTVSETTLTVDENLGTGTFTVVLNTEPISDVVLDVLSDDTNEATVSASSLTFTAGNWDSPQTVTVTGVDDAIDRDDNATITVLVNDASSDDTYDALDDQTVAITLTDDDVVPTVSTTTAATIASTSVVMGGDMSDSGSAEVTETGVVYSSVNTSPKLGGADVTTDTNGAETGTFSETIGSLTPETKYFFQAYATNSAGTSYGGVQSFTTKKSQTITFTAISEKTYGDSDFDPAASATSGLTVAYSSSDASVATIVDGKIHIVGAGSCTVYADQEGDSEYDAAPQVAQTLTVNKATLTATADDKSKTYGETNPALTISYSGFVGSESESDLTTAPTAATTATDASVVGDYPITVSGGSDDNYAINPVDGTLTVNKATLTATADDKSKTYGEANPALTISYSGFVEGDSESDLTTAPTAATTATNASVVGDYTITVSGGSDDNYDFNLVNGTLTVNKTTLTVTAEDKSKIYGEDNPVLTVSYNGFIGSDSESDLTAAPAASTTATAASGVGDYPITVSGGADDNYDFSYTDGTLTVGKATLTATADDKSKTYGEVNPTLTISYSGFVGSESESDLTTAPTAATTATDASGVGDYAITVSGGSDDNYDINLLNGTLTVSEATLTVTVDNQSKTYGEANPELTFSYSGFVGSDSESDLTTAPTTATAATTVSGAGTYPITVSGGIDDNYLFSYENATLTIDKATLTATADNQSKTYGDANPALTISYSGFVGSDTKSDIDAPPAASTTATDASAVGDYTISVSGGNDENYDLNPVDGTLTIEKATLTVTGATAQDKTYDGTTNAIITGASLSGVVFSDDVTLVNKTSGIFAQAIIGVDIEVTTSMTLTGNDADNYTLVQPSGLKADINGKELTITGSFTADDKVYDGTADASLATNSLVLSGIERTDEVSLNNVVVAFESASAGSALIVSITSADLIGSKANQYSLSYTGSPTTTASILKKEATLAGATALTKTYDGTTMLPDGETGYGTLNGILPGDETQVALTGSPLFDATNAGSRTVIQGSLALTGAKADNYSLKWTDGSGTIDKAPLTVTVNNDAKFVTQPDNSGYAGISITGYVNGEESSTIDQTGLTITRSNSTENLAGEYTGVLEASGLDATNYTFSYQSGSYTIIPADELLIQVTDNSVVYSNTPAYVISSAEYLDSDQNTIAVLTDNLTVLGDNQFSISDGAGGTVNFTISEVSPQYNSLSTRLAAGSYQLEATDISGSSVNFNNNMHTTGALTINTKGVDVQLVAGSEQKAFDGDADMDNLDLEVQGLVSGDEVTVSENGSFNQSDAGTNIPYSVSFALLGQDKGNYHLNTTSPITGNDGRIGGIEVTVTDAIAQNKAYDGTTDAVITGATLQGTISGDDVSLANKTAGTFEQSTVGNSLKVVTAMTLSGDDKDNYILVQPTGLTANITPAELTVIDAVAEDKVYDGNTDAVITGASLSGVIGSDNVTLENATSGTFAQSAVGTDISVTPAMTLSGAFKDNYTLVQPSDVAANITPAELTVTGAEAQNKVYDGTSDAEITGASLSGIIDLDVVTLENAASGTFAQTTIGTGISVTTAMTLSGSAKDNYTLNQPDGLLADITPAELTITGSFTAENKVYDGTIDATMATNNLLFSGMVSGDVVTPTNVLLAFVTPNAETGVETGITGAEVAGGHAEQYTVSLEGAPVAHADITKRELTVTADAKTKVQGSSNPTLTYAYSGFVNGEDESVLNTKPVASTTVDVSTPAGTYQDIITIDGGSDNNYSFTYVAANFTVTTAVVSTSVNIGNLEQVYDGAPKEVSVTTSPAGVDFTITYNGSSEAPVNVGEYQVIVTVNKSGYTGSALGTLKILADNDRDGIPDISDPDDDNDGVPDEEDAFPYDPTETLDSDGDGVGDNSDAFPNDPTEWSDTDGDGIGDNSDPDIDGDGVSNEEDAFPYDPTETVDSDGDGVGDNSDAFPNDPTEWADTDGDGIGDNSDPDIDGDGVSNEEDALPL